MLTILSFFAETNAETVHNNVCAANNAVSVGRNLLLALKHLVEARGCTSRAGRVLRELVAVKINDKAIDYSDLLGTGDLELSAHQQALAKRVLIVSCNFARFAADLTTTCSYRKSKWR